MSILAMFGTKALLKRGIIHESEICLYEYGFELLFSTIITIIFVVLQGILCGELARAITFIVFFMPIRTVAGGYHAKSYGRCLLLTIFISMVCVWGSKILYIKCRSVWGILLVFVMVCKYLWKHAPIVPLEYRGKTNREKTNRRYTHNVLWIEIISILVLVNVSKELMYTAIITSCVVAFMVVIVEKGGT